MILGKHNTVEEFKFSFAQGFIRIEYCLLVNGSSYLFSFVSSI